MNRTKLEDTKILMRNESYRGALKRIATTIKTKV